MNLTKIFSITLLLVFMVGCGAPLVDREAGSRFGIKPIPENWINEYENIERGQCYEKWVNPDPVTIPRFHSKWVKCGNIHGGNPQGLWFIQDNYLIELNDTIFHLGRLFDAQDDSNSNPITYRLYEYGTEPAIFDWFQANAAFLKEIPAVDAEVMLKSNGLE